MAYQSSQVGSEESSLIPSYTPPSELKTYGFVIAIILGIGGLAAGGAGVAGYFQVGALHSMAQIDAIIMMVAGGGGVILFIAGIVGTVKNYQSRDDKDRDYQAYLEAVAALTKQADQVRLVYGPEAWPELGQKWGCTLDILDEIPEAPQMDVTEGTIRLYIPKMIKVDGVEEKEFTLNSLREIGGGPFAECTQDVSDLCGNDTASGWIDIDASVIKPSSNFKSYRAQQEGLNRKGYRMPKVLEAVVLNLMVFAFTGVRLYGTDSYTRCCEKTDGNSPAVVGGFGVDGLHARHFYGNILGDGVAAVRMHKAIDN